MPDRAEMNRDYWRCPVCRKEIGGGNGQWRMVKQTGGEKRPVHVLCIEAQAKENKNA